MTKPDLMAELAEVPCSDCGMPCKVDEYHPFAACLMFKACHNSEVVRANLFFVVESGRAAHHAELEAVVRDAARYRWLRESEAMLWKDGDSHPVDFDLDTAIDAQMHNSAREG